MSAPGGDTEAIIQAAGQGTRLGLGPKAFVALGERTLLERAVETMHAVAARVTVAVAQRDIERAHELLACPAVRVIAGGERRIDTLRALVDAADAPWLVLHDVVHPLVTAELAREVLAGARTGGAAAAVQRMPDFLYDDHGTLRASPGEVVAIQKPIAFRGEAMRRGFAALDAADAAARAGDPGALEILARGGQRVSFVAGHAMSLKLTTAGDLVIARRLIAAPGLARD